MCCLLLSSTRAADPDLDPEGQAILRAELPARSLVCARRYLVAELQAPPCRQRVPDLVYPGARIRSLVQEADLRLLCSRRTLVWEVLVYQRESV